MPGSLKVLQVFRVNTGKSRVLEIFAKSGLLLGKHLAGNDEVLDRFARRIEQNEDIDMVCTNGAWLDWEVVSLAQCLDLNREISAGSWVVSQKVDCFCVAKRNRGL